ERRIRTLENAPRLVVVVSDSLLPELGPAVTPRVLCRALRCAQSERDEGHEERAGDEGPALGSTASREAHPENGHGAADDHGEAELRPEEARHVEDIEGECAEGPEDAAHGMAR